MKHYVFDAGALTLFFAGDEQLLRHKAEIASKRAEAHCNPVNVAEFYYKAMSVLGRQTAESWFYRLLASGIDVTPTNPESAREVGQLRNKYVGRLSLADCFALAQASNLKATLLTTDADFEGVSEATVTLLHLKPKR